MSAIYEHKLVVAAEEIDVLGHAGNLVYLKWMMSAATAHSAVQGWTAERHLALGAGWVVRSHQIQYLRPALAGDEIVVRTWVSDWSRVTSSRRYRILRGASEALLANAVTEWAFVNYKTGRPTRIPPEVEQAFEVASSAAKPHPGQQARWP